MYKLCILFLYILLLSSCGENSYVNGLKVGKWTEYLDSLQEKEVPKDSAYYLRKLEYKDGFPMGLISQFRLQNNILRNEFYLSSGPYLKDSKRPKDSYKGVFKIFDDTTGKIKNWVYYDDYGKPDYKKYFVLGLDEIIKDNRHDTSVFSKNGLKPDNIFYKNPKLYDSVYTELKKTIRAIYSTPITKKLVAKEFKSDEDGMLFSVLKSGSSIDFIKYINQSLAVIKQYQNIRSNSNNNYYSNSQECRWCNRKFNGGGYTLHYYPPASNPLGYRDSGGDFCSARCANEAKAAGGFEWDRLH